MELLISPAEVVEIAFQESEGLRGDIIKDPVIRMAEIKYIKPVLGSFYDNIREERYREFVNKFIKPPLAFYVRSLVVDNLTVSLGNLGAMQYSADKMKTAPENESAKIKKKARYDADTLLKHAIDYMENHSGEFPSYDRRENIKNRIEIKGGIIL